MARVKRGLSVEHKRKLSKAHKGKRLSQSHREAIGRGNMGHAVSKEARRKIGLANSVALKGRKLSKETREKMSVVAKERGFGKWMKGRKMSWENKQKLIIANTGRTPWNKGKKMSEEFGAKMRTMRHTEEAKKKIKANNAKYWLGKKRPEISGENNPCWKGGTSFEPYSVDWTESLRRAIRERDGYVCRLCGERQGDKAFAIHHIDYNKKNNNQNNLITLCFSCHGKTSHNRGYWENMLTNIINAKDDREREQEMVNQAEQETVCGNPHNNAEETCLECEIIQHNI